MPKPAGLRSPRVTSSDVARFVGVSQATVSRAFAPDSSITDLTRAKILDAARALNYVPNSLARGLITNRSNIVAMLIGDLHNPFHNYNAALDGFSSRLQAIGKQLLVFKYVPSEGVESTVRRMLEYQIDGLIVTAATLPKRATELCLERDIPVVLFNRHVPGLRVSSVRCNDVAGGRLAAEALVEGGAGRYAVIQGDRAASTNAERVDGFVSRLRESGRDAAAVKLGHYTYDGGYRAAMTLLKRRERPDGLFCANDIMALGAIDAARSLGLDLPRDLMIVGFGDIEEAARPPYRLTTIRQPMTRMIDAAMGLLTQPGEPATRIFEGKLIRRATTR